MDQETIVNSRPDRELRKKILKPGDYNIVPYEESRCKIVLSEIKCFNDTGDCEIESESRIFSRPFDGNVLIGDTDSFIDKDFELILQQMCCGESSEATMVYRDSENRLVIEIRCKIELLDVMEEQLISDWSQDRLYEAATYHKERGVELVKGKRIADAFRRFSKALKMVVAIEPVDPKVMDEEKIREIVDLKVKLYNNLAFCQLQFNEYEAALQLCEKSLKYEPDNVKALYRRCVAYHGMQQYEEAWADICKVLELEPNDKAAHQYAIDLRPKIKKNNAVYTNVFKKMFQ